MMTAHKGIKNIKPAIVFLITLFLLTGCGGAENNSDFGESGDYDFSYIDRDLDASYDEKDATIITLSNDKITADGNGVEIDDNTLFINSEGTYLVSGSLSDGQIVIDTPDNEKVQLILNGVNISSSGSAPLLIRESDKVFLTLSSGSRNTLTGPAAYSDEAAGDGIDGVIYSKADFCINGTGMLSVIAESGHGIVSKDDLIVTGGDISVTAAGDGIQGKDCVKIKDGAFVIAAENDGIKSSNADEPSRGFVSIDGGSFDITAGYDGIQAETVLRIAEGDVNITTGGGSQNADTQDGRGGVQNGQTPDNVMPSDKNSQNSQMPGNTTPDDRGGQAPSNMIPSDRDGQTSSNIMPNDKGGQVAGSTMPDSRSGQANEYDKSQISPDKPPEQGNGENGSFAPGDRMNTAPSDPTTDESADTAADTASTKGLKAGLKVMLLGGGITIDSLDDSIHSNGDIEIENCTISAMSGDDGIHADSDLTVNSGSLHITQSYESLEGNTITINNGDLDIVASDDGLNAAGGSDSSSTNDRPGQNEFEADESAFIEINGGNLTIHASGDGIDSNGTLDITDGAIIVSCPTRGDTAALDFSGTGTISGGTFIGTGAVQMAQTFDASKQGVVSVSMKEQSAGTTITLTDNNGNIILTYEADQSFAIVILSSPDIVSGNTYILKVGTLSEEVTAN